VNFSRNLSFPLYKKSVRCTLASNASALLIEGVPNLVMEKLTEDIMTEDSMTEDSVREDSVTEDSVTEDSMTEDSVTEDTRDVTQ
jgi:pentapeptide MXKDX repeat protein